MSQALGAAFDAAWARNPASSYLRAVEDEVARFNTDGWVPAEEARERVAAAGLPLNIPDEGIGARGLDLLMQRKKEEMRHEQVLSRAPRGILASAATFASGLSASILDPINVAVSFVPVIGEERLAYLLARAGEGAVARAGVRAGVGGVRGATGAVLVEPIVYAQAQQEQADYGLANSLLNVAFGTVMGAGLHAGMGALSDRLGATKVGKAPPEPSPIARELEALPADIREAAFRGAIAHEIQGRPAAVEQFLRPLMEVMPRDIDGPASGGLLEMRMTERIRELDAALKETGGVTTAQIAAWKKETASLIAERGRLMDERYTPATLRRAETRELRRDIHRRYVVRRQRIAAIKDRLDALEALRAGATDKNAAAYARIDRALREVQEGRRPALEGLGIPVGPPERALVREAVNAVTRRDPLFRRENVAAVRRVAAPESSRTADFEASRTAEARIAESPKEYTPEEAAAVLADEEAALRDLEAATGRDFTRDLEGSAEEMKDATAMAGALDRLAGCTAVFR